MDNAKRNSLLSSTALPGYNMRWLYAPFNGAMLDKAFGL